MILNLKKYFLRFFIIVTIAFCLHVLLYRAFLSNTGLSIQFLSEIYIFLIVLSAVHIIAIYWLFKKWPRYSGFIFTGLSLGKMLFSILYLFPYIFPSNEQSIMWAMNFMALYFVLLTYEVIFIAKSMGKNH